MDKVVVVVACFAVVFVGVHAPPPLFTRGTVVAVPTFFFVVFAAAVAN
jgi:hypothetical protein